MPLVQWSRKYELGVYIFDAEHRQLLGHVNDLYEVIIAGVRAPAVLTVLRGVSTFVARHSAHEEAFFQISGYPNAAAHAAEHRRLAQDLRELGQAGVDPYAVAYDMNAFLLTWFSDHILGLDREFCMHLRKIGVH